MCVFNFLVGNVIYVLPALAQQSTYWSCFLHCNTMDERFWNDVINKRLRHELLPPSFSILFIFSFSRAILSFKHTPFSFTDWHHNTEYIVFAAAKMKSCWEQINHYCVRVCVCERAVLRLYSGANLHKSVVIRYTTMKAFIIWMHRKAQ